ncbi:unnamed protein product [Linum tenue]|uniref:Cobalamin-independent methionine synthase MetE C-terminal/archaeal domain-containing protein n=1 Tax=Linum tenue TaxID=586396 RepID=A0AAV0KUW8_9ROSI|nr:unnamed protein product [Linum tenue]
MLLLLLGENPLQGSQITLFRLLHETFFQIKLAIKDEVEYLEKAGINVIQIDEAALGEGLPLRKLEHAFYMDWAVHSFRITNCGVQDTTQIPRVSRLYMGSLNCNLGVLVELSK